MTVCVHHQSLVTRRPCVYLFRPPPLVSSQESSSQSEQSGARGENIRNKNRFPSSTNLGNLFISRGLYTEEGNLNININTPINRSPVSMFLSRWGIGMFLGSLISGGVSGGHLNPSVTVSRVYTLNPAPVMAT